MAWGWTGGRAQPDHKAARSEDMQLWFNILMVSGAIAGVLMGALAHPKVYAGVFGGQAGSADHDGRQG